MTFTHIDCFSCPGGICTGFKAAGIETLLEIEKIKSCVETYSANHKNVHVIENDIRNVTAEKFCCIFPKAALILLLPVCHAKLFQLPAILHVRFMTTGNFFFVKEYELPKSPTPN